MFRGHNRVKKATVWVFLGVTYVMSLATVWQIGTTQAPTLPPEVVIYDQYRHELRNLSKELRNVLKQLADGKISVEEAAKQISDAFAVAAANTGVIEQVRTILQRALHAGTNEAYQKALKELTNLFESLEKPIPSPIPTDTIVIPRN